MARLSTSVIKLGALEHLMSLLCTQLISFRLLCMQHAALLREVIPWVNLLKNMLLPFVWFTHAFIDTQTSKELKQYTSIR